MGPILTRISALRDLREEAQRTLARHPAVVLECGVLSTMAPAPNPILPSDICNQIIHLSDTTSFALPIRMDKTAMEICELVRSRLRSSHGEDLALVEVKSSGEKVVFYDGDVSIATMLSLNSKLYVVSKDEIDSLVPQLDQNGPVESVHASVMEYVGSHELAQQLLVLHTQLFERLPAKLRRQFAEFESLLDPSRNHRPYRALVAKIYCKLPCSASSNFLQNLFLQMSPPLIPFVPLLLKDLTFIHEGNKTYYNGLVNFEKMHMIANILRSFRQCKSRYSGGYTFFFRKSVSKSRWPLIMHLMQLGGCKRCSSQEESNFR
ncbi:RasGEF domain protein [Oesophagostomum dentatum]|uniref:RasGEF domain protein n=1 Tax=Oesophagostomum dentatum TaxID=61180 RepID=A0A0B1SPD1_OESDE|nr:RasGEF domain protein [Oesophagostomum dentatum]